MTTLFESSETEAGAGEPGVGRVVRVIGPVVDVEFGRNNIPAIYNALTVEITLGELSKTLTLEVAQHIGDEHVGVIGIDIDVLVALFGNQQFSVAAASDAEHVGEEIEDVFEAIPIVIVSL